MPQWGFLQKKQAYDGASQIYAAGKFRPVARDPEARLRGVVVGLREATLVLSDPKTETALSQWSLPAVERLNPGKMPALYGVGDADSETLEIDDPDMALAGNWCARRWSGGASQGGCATGWWAGWASPARPWRSFGCGQDFGLYRRHAARATRADLGQDALEAKLTGSVRVSMARQLAALGKRVNRPRRRRLW